MAESLFFSLHTRTRFSSPDLKVTSLKKKKKKLQEIQNQAAAWNPLPLLSPISLHFPGQCQQRIQLSVFICKSLKYLLNLDTHISIRSHSFHRLPIDSFPQTWTEAAGRARWYWLSNLVYFFPKKELKEWGCYFPPCLHFQNAHTSKACKCVIQKESILHFTWALYYSSVPHLKAQTSNALPCHLGKALHSQPQK